MTVRSILIHPDARLRRTARPVTEFDDRLHALLTDLEDTMYEADGIGLAASQSRHQPTYRGDGLRSGKQRTSALQLINPEICPRSDQTELRAEGKTEPTQGHSRSRPATPRALRIGIFDKPHVDAASVQNYCSI